MLENEEQVSATEALAVNPGIQRKIIYLSNSFPPPSLSATSIYSRGRNTIRND